MTLHGHARHDDDAHDAALIPLGAILVDPAKNFIRGGRVEAPSHPIVKKIIESLQSNGGRLLQCLGLRRLKKPLARPCGKGPCCDDEATGEHTFELVYGYRRYIAIKACGWNALSLDEAEAKILEDCGDDEAEDCNAIENLVRADPTEYEVALAFAGLQKKRNLQAKEVAALVGAPSVYYVESLVRIVTRVPDDVLEQWALAPTREHRRVLDRISKIDAQDRMPADARAERMRQEWAMAQAAVDAGPSPDAASDPASTPGRMGRPKGSPNRYPMTMRLPELESLASTVDRASEIYDADTGWRPLTTSEKRAIVAMLVHVADPKTTRAPIR